MWDRGVDASVKESPRNFVQFQFFVFFEPSGFLFAGTTLDGPHTVNWNCVSVHHFVPFSEVFAKVYSYLLKRSHVVKPFGNKRLLIL